MIIIPKKDIVKNHQMPRKYIPKKISHDENPIGRWNKKSKKRRTFKWYEDYL